MPSWRDRGWARQARQAWRAPVRRHRGREPSADRWRVQTFETGPRVVIVVVATKGNSCARLSHAMVTFGASAAGWRTQLHGDGARSPGNGAEAEPFLLHEARHVDVERVQGVSAQ